ncbi:TonB-dependent receptor [Vibrio sp.]|nr:TonB-dependent receptor [Vibrio sp.]
MKKSALAMAVAASLFSYASTSYAASDSAQTTDDTVVVTANRFEQKEDSVLASTTVITKDEISTTRANSVLDLLKTLAGVEVVSSGGKSQTTSIFMRGSGSKHTLVLVDGIRVNSLTSGDSSIGLVPAFAVEKIEIIRGPRAAAYGSDAIGGVISITTTDNYNSEHKARAGYGSHDHSLLGWKSAGELTDSTKGEFIISQEKSDGYKVFSAAPSGDTHGYKAQTFIGHLDHSLNDNWSLQLSGFKSDSYSEYAGGTSAKQKTDTDLEMLAGIVKYSRDIYSSELQLSTRYNEDKSGAADDSDAKSILRTRRNSLSWLNGLAISDFSFAQLGLEYNQDKADRLGDYSSNYGETEKHTQSVFATSSSNFNDFTFELSARYDDSSSFGGHSTWNTGLGYWLTDELEVVGSYGTAYKEPTFNDLYWPAGTYSEGNPNLKPESSESREIAIRGYHSSLSWELSAYRTDIEDMIEWASVGSVYTPSNVSQARIDGIELTIKFETGPVSHKLVADWKDPVDSSDGSQLDKRAKNKYSWEMLYSHNAWEGSVVTNYTGSRVSSGEWLDSYITVDASLSYDVTSNFNVGLKVENLFDENYQTGYYSSYSAYYVGDERNIFAELEYKF